MQTNTQQNGRAVAGWSHDLSELAARAWAAFQVYGEDHPVFDRSAAAIIEPLATAPESQRLLLVQNDESSSELDPDSFAGHLHALDIGAVEFGPDAGAQDLASLFRLVKHARPGKDIGGQLAERVADRIGERIKLAPMDYGRLADQVSGAPPTKRTGAHRLDVGELRSVLIGATTPEDREAAAKLIGRSLNQDGFEAQCAAEDIRTAARESHEGDADHVDHIRGVLGSLSPEIRAGLLRDDSGPDLEAITDLAGVLPVLDTCEALAEANLTPENICHSTLMMFQRLATLTGGRAHEIERVGSLASGMLGDQSGSPEAQAIRSISDLCHQARQEEFTPEEYLERLHQICADQIEPVADMPDLDWETPEQEQIHACEIVLTLIDQEIGSEGDLADHLRSIQGAVDAASNAGRVDLLLRISQLCLPLKHDPRPEVRALAESLAASSVDQWTLARAIAESDSESEFARQVELVERGIDTPVAAILLRAYRLAPMSAAASWIVPRLERVSASLSAEIATLLETDPYALEVLLALINALDRDSAFEAIRPALAANADAESRRRAFAAVYTIRHPWPEDLCHYAIINDDPTVRSLGVGYVARRAAADRLPMLGARLLHSLGGPAPSDNDCRAIINELLKVGSDEAMDVLVRTLIAASYHRGGRAPGVGSMISAALRQHQGCRRARAAHWLWRLSPNRCIAAMRHRNGGDHAG